MIFTFEELLSLRQFSYPILQIVVHRFRKVPIYTFYDFFSECTKEAAILDSKDSQPDYDALKFEPQAKVISHGETRQQIGEKLSSVDNPFAKLLAQRFSQ